MKVDTTQVLKTLDGQVMKDNDGQGNAVDATLKMALVNSILSPVQKESGIDKVKKFNLAQRVYKDDEVELTAEDITLIKERVGETFAPIIVGQVWNILEGKNGI
jgi:hypothetical protein